MQLEMRFGKIVEASAAIILPAAKMLYSIKRFQLQKAMDKKTSNMILKVAALLLAAVGLISMIVAWELLLFAGQYTNTVIFMEMSGVAVCMIAFFLWRKAKSGA